MDGWNPNNFYLIVAAIGCCSSKFFIPVELSISRVMPFAHLNVLSDGIHSPGFVLSCHKQNGLEEESVCEADFDRDF